MAGGAPRLGQIGRAGHLPDPDRCRAPLRAPAARSGLRGLPCPAHRARDCRGDLDGRRRHRGRGPASGRRRPDRVRAQERPHHRHRQRGPGDGAFGPDLAQPQGAAERPHRARKHRPGLAAPDAALRRGRHACAQVRNARGARGQRARQGRGPARDGRGAGCAICRPGRCRGRARPHRSRQDAVGGLPRARAGASMPAPTCARSGSSRQPSSSTTAAARASGGCRSSTSISTIAAAAARSPAAPRSSRSPGPGRSTSAPTSIETPTSLQLAVSVQGLVPRGLARSLPQLAGLEGLDVPVWAEAQLEISNTGEILSGTIGIDAAPGTGLAALAGGDAAAHRWRASRAVLRLGRAPLRDRALGAGWGDSRVQFTGTVAHTAAGRRRAALGLRLASRPAAGSAPSRRIIQQLTIDDWSARGFLVAGARPRRAQSVRAAGRRRRDVRPGRRRGHGRRHAGAPRRQDRADAGRHLQGAVAQRAGAAHARLGGASIWCAAGCRAALSGSATDAGVGAGSGWAATHGALACSLDAGGGQPRLQCSSTAGRRWKCRARLLRLDDADASS